MNTNSLLSNFSPIDNKEMLLLNIVKSNLEIVDNTRSQPQETLEFKMTKQKATFSFDTPIDLPDKWMMGITSLEVYNTVYNITEKNNFFLVELDSDLLFKISEKKIAPIVEKLGEQFTKPVSKEEFLKALKKETTGVKFNQNDFDNFLEAFNILKLGVLTPLELGSLLILDETDNQYCQIWIRPGVYELKEINTTIQRVVTNLNKKYEEIYPDARKIEISVTIDTISMNSILKTSHPINFTNNWVTFNKVLGFTQTNYPKGIHRSEKPIMITPIDKVHLKCDCVDGSIVNGIRESILFSFNLSKPPGYKIIKEPTTILYKKINRTKLDRITFYLEDTDHNPVDFNGESLTFTVQIIKI